MRGEWPAASFLSSLVSIADGERDFSFRQVAEITPFLATSGSAEMITIRASISIHAFSSDISGQ